MCNCVCSVHISEISVCTYLNILGIHAYTYYIYIHTCV